ncbi:MAG: FeoA domain-containing protein [Desulfobulbus sp.]
MYSSLLDAPVRTDLILLDVTHPGLRRWLQRLGLYAGSHLMRHDEEVNYFPVRVRTRRGDVVVPAGLGIRVFVHVATGERKPLVEMQRKERGHVETMSCGRGCVQALDHLGLAEEAEVTFIRALPHMDYVTVIERRERTRLTEGEAARLWGKSEDGVERQFYFAPRNQPFGVSDIIGGHKVIDHLRTHGITPGCSLVLESIEQTRELHKPGVEPVTISSQSGLRLYLNRTQAAQVIVKSDVRHGADADAGQQVES